MAIAGIGAEDIGALLAAAALVAIPARPGDGASLS
jgi:hypothetical protein